MLMLMWGWFHFHFILFFYRYFIFIFIFIFFICIYMRLVKLTFLCSTNKSLYGQTGNNFSYPLSFFRNEIVIWFFDISAWHALLSVTVHWVFGVTVV